MGIFCGRYMKRATVCPTAAAVVVVEQYGPANKKHLIWASLRLSSGRHLETTLRDLV